MSIPKGGIAFFDSGIGGLTVLSECRKYLPNEIFYYFGDNRHAPYGNLSERKIKKYTFRAFRRLKKLRPKVAVVACNTVTAVCIEKLRKKYSFPIIGAEPALNLALNRAKGEVFALMTTATCNSQRIKKRFVFDENAHSNVNICFCACAHLAEEIERHILDKEYDYAWCLPQGEPSAVVLGCTHYIYIKDFIQNFYGCECYDGNEGIAKRLQSELCRLKKSKKAKMDEDGPKNDFFRDEQPLNRDERPPSKIRPNFVRFFVSKFVFLYKRLKMLNMNKCSHYANIPRKLKAENIRDSRIFFLGKAKNYNAHIYKQMFVFY